VAVVGAGLAGLSAARTLADHGHEVVVFDKSRGTGGRCATRRSEHAPFDHGAQYFTRRARWLKPYLWSWIDRGLVQRWDARIAVFEDRERQADASARDRYVAVPGMSALGRHLAEDLDLRFSTAVAPLERRDGPDVPWRLHDVEGRALGEFDAVIVTAPPAKAVALVADAAPALAGRAAEQTMEPCWAVMAAFDQPLNLDFDAAFLNDGSLSWAANNASKPGRPDAPAWVIHADGGWSKEHLERSPEWVAGTVLEAFFDQVGAERRAPVYASAHRWRYARPESSLDLDCLWDGERGIGLAGDWCRGGRVEAALLSGRAVAGRLLAVSLQEQGG
jgi:predicted NAD/FAD-dependent oxidoreductase